MGLLVVTLIRESLVFLSYQTTHSLVSTAHRYLIDFSMPLWTSCSATTSAAKWKYRHSRCDTYRHLRTIFYQKLLIWVLLYYVSHCCLHCSQYILIRAFLINTKIGNNNCESYNELIKFNPNYKILQLRCLQLDDRLLV